MDEIIVITLNMPMFIAVGSNKPNAQTCTVTSQFKDFSDYVTVAEQKPSRALTRWLLLVYEIKSLTQRSIFIRHSVDTKWHVIICLQWRMRKLLSFSIGSGCGGCCCCCCCWICCICCCCCCCFVAVVNRIPGERTSSSYAATFASHQTKICLRIFLHCSKNTAIIPPLCNRWTLYVNYVVRHKTRSRHTARVCARCVVCATWHIMSSFAKQLFF